MQNLSLRERLAMTAVAAALLLLTVGGLVVRGRGATATPAVPAAGEEKAGSAEPLEIVAQGDGGKGEASPAPALSTEEQLPPASSKLVVHVAGAVNRPGVYTLKAGDRLYHAIRAAGGFKPNARQDALNLADAVRDADQIHVPTKQAPPSPQQTSTAAQAGTPVREIRLPPARLPADPPPQFVRRGTAPYATIVKSSGGSVGRGRVLGVAPAPVLGSLPPTHGSAPLEQEPGQAPTPTAAQSGETAGAPEGASSAKFKSPGDGTVDLNSASLEDLQRLPGVGPSTAQRILDYRQEIGRFTDAKQLMDVKGIGEKKFAKMQPFVTVQ